MFPEYSYKHHPLFNAQSVPSPNFKSPPTQPVVLHRYHRFISGRALETGCQFLPISPSFHQKLTPSSALDKYATLVDAIAISTTSSRRVTDPQRYFVSSFHSSVRITLVMDGRQLHKRFGNASENNLGEEWSDIFIAQSQTWKGSPVSKPKQYLATERVVQEGEELVLPYPRSIYVDGVQVTRYSVLVSKPDKSPVGFLQAFEFPELPAGVRNPATGELVSAEQRRPNQRGPTWLHNLYSVPARHHAGTSSTHGDSYPKEWRTWHPIIDPVYWCYFGHEHGAWPGQWYSPQFEYTAFHTEDTSTTSGRQN